MKTSKNSRTSTTSGTQPKPELTVSDSNQHNKRLKAALLAECHELVRLSKYDPKTGVSIWPHVPHAHNECARCTNGAKLIAQTFSGYIAGYSFDVADPQTLVGASVWGHDFAVVGDFIVDWWGWEYEGTLKTPVLTRAEGIALGLFKPEENWQICPEFDFRPAAEAIKPVRISYERWLVKYRPIKNPFDRAAPCDGCLFENYAATLRQPGIRHSRKIWTLAQWGNELRILDGYHYVNRLGYFVTEVAAPGNRYFSIKID